MGWTSCKLWTRATLIKDRIEDWHAERDGVRMDVRCLAKCYRGGMRSGVLWAVWERTWGDERKSERWISCDLLRYHTTEGWAYKDMCESVHPYYYSCPIKYLDMVPEDGVGVCLEWRAKVRTLAAEKKRIRKERNARQLA